MPRMVRLASCPAFTFLAQTPGRWLFLQAIAARWFATVATVFGKLVFQFLNMHRLLGYHLAQFENDCDQTCFIQFVQRVFILSHAFTKIAFGSNRHLLA